MEKRVHHVVPNPSGGWSVTRGGATRASRRFETKEEAISWGRSLSKRKGTVFAIHKRDGTVQSVDSYSRDPQPPRHMRNG